MHGFINASVKKFSLWQRKISLQIRKVLPSPSVLFEIVFIIMCNCGADFSIHALLSDPRYTRMCLDLLTIMREILRFMFHIYIYKPTICATGNASLRRIMQFLNIKY